MVKEHNYSPSTHSTNVEGARLHLMAVEALQNNQMSAYAALSDFQNAIVAEGGVAAALILWDENEASRLLTSYLRATLGEQRNEERPTPERLRPVTSPKASEARSNVEAPPTREQLDRSLRNKTKTYAAAFNEVTIDGQPIHTFSHGQARSLIPVKERRITTLGNEVERETFEVNILRMVVSHTNPEDHTMSIAETMTEKQFKAYVRKARKGES